MKLRLQENKQRELLYRTKGNKSWRQLAATLGTERHVLTNLAREKTLLSEDLFKRLEGWEDSEGYIVEKLPDNWGQIKGGKLSTGTTKKITKPEKSKKLAELIGIILGDGNIHISRDKKSTGYMVRIVGDSRTDGNYLINYVKPLCESLFDVNAKIRKDPQKNALILTINSKQVVEYLLSAGMCAGDKIKNKTTIPKWIYDNNDFLQWCIRGLVDTDGSVYELLPNYPGTWQIYFSNRNDRLLQDFKSALTKLNIHSSNISGRKSTPRIYITKKVEIRKFYKEIGFSNFKHKNKIAPWCSGLI